MKKVLLTLMALLTLACEANAKTVETTLWNDTYTDGVELSGETVATFKAGDVLRVYVTVPEGGANFKICYKGESNGWAETTIPSLDTQWPWVNGDETYKDITFTDADISAFEGNGIYIYKGENSTITKVTLITTEADADPTQTLWEGTYTDDGIEINSETVSGFKAGDVLRVYVTVPEGGANFKIVYKGESNNWAETTIPSLDTQWPWVNGDETYKDITFTAADITALSGNGIYIYKGENSTITKVTLTVAEADFTITVNASEHGTVKANMTSANEGDEVTLTITPDEGYELDELTVIYEKTGDTANSDGAGFAANAPRRINVGDYGTVTVTDNKFTMPKGNVIITATFKEKTVEPEPEKTYTLTVSKEWMTFCSPVTFAVPSGLKAYTVTAVTEPNNGQTGTLTIQEETIVEANVPMLIQNNNTSITAFTVTEAEGNVSGTTATQYKGSTTATTIDKGCYVLIDGTFLRTNGGSLAAYNCYLDLSNSNARGFSIEMGSNTTAIQTIGAAQIEADKWHTLNGVSVSEPTQKGVYIKNGKKIIVR